MRYINPYLIRKFACGYVPGLENTKFWDFGKGIPLKVGEEKWKKNQNGLKIAHLFTIIFVFIAQYLQK